jgi:DNA-binding MarR family transcriptional regulator
MASIDALNARSTNARPGQAGGRIVETIVYLYTESRRLTKGMAREVGSPALSSRSSSSSSTFGDLSLSTLSERIRAQNSTVTGIIDRMEREGLVLRERSKTDRRVVYIRSRPRARQLAKDVQVEPMEIFRDALSALARRHEGPLEDPLKLQKRVKAREGSRDRGARPRDEGAR